MTASARDHFAKALPEQGSENPAAARDRIQEDAAPRTSETPPSSRQPAQRAVIRPAALSYHLLKPRSVGPADVPLIGEAYRCWAGVWREAFYELGSTRELPSDDFTRQDEVAALFHGYECVALSFFRWVDLSSLVNRDDSYFSVWSAAARDAAAAEGSSICISSHFTIAAPWRRASGCSLKDVVAGLVIERFLASDADALVGTMRNNRGMNTLVYRSGFKTILQNVVHHGVEVDLTAFYRKSCVRAPASPDDEAIIQSLRPRRTAGQESV